MEKFAFLVFLWVHSSSNARNPQAVNITDRPGGGSGWWEMLNQLDSSLCNLSEVFQTYLHRLVCDECELQVSSLRSALREFNFPFWIVSWNRFVGTGD